MSGRNGQGAWPRWRRLLQLAVVALVLHGGATACRATCGNGILEAGEECDDNNTADGDGCSATCEVDCPIETGPGAPGNPSPPSTCVVTDANAGTKQCKNVTSPPFQDCLVATDCPLGIPRECVRAPFIDRNANGLFDADDMELPYSAVIATTKSPPSTPTCDMEAAAGWQVILDPHPPGGELVRYRRIAPTDLCNPFRTKPADCPISASSYNPRELVQIRTPYGLTIPLDAEGFNKSAHTLTMLEITAGKKVRDYAFAGLKTHLFGGLKIVASDIYLGSLRCAPTEKDNVSVAFGEAPCTSVALHAVGEDGRGGVVCGGAYPSGDRHEVRQIAEDDHTSVFITANKKASFLNGICQLKNHNYPRDGDCTDGAQPIKNRCFFTSKRCTRDTPDCDNLSSSPVICRTGWKLDEQSAIKGRIILKSCQVSRRPLNSADPNQGAALLRPAAGTKCQTNGLTVFGGQMPPMQADDCSEDFADLADYCLTMPLGTCLCTDAWTGLTSTGGCVEQEACATGQLCLPSDAVSDTYTCPSLNGNNADGW